MKSFAVFDIDDPLARIPGESKRANSALRDYFFMGDGRSLRKLLEIYKEQSLNNSLTTPPALRFITLANWSSSYFWQDRISRMTEIEREKDYQLWESRRRQIRETDYSNAQRLRDLFDRAMDEAPNFIKTRRKFIAGKDGSPDREIVTLSFDTNAVARIAELASKLDRLAAEMETERTRSDVSGSITTNAIPGIDFTDLTDEQIAETLARQSRIANQIARRIRDSQSRDDLSNDDPVVSEKENDLSVDG